MSIDSLSGTLAVSNCSNYLNLKVAKVVKRWPKYRISTTDTTTFDTLNEKPLALIATVLKLVLHSYVFWDID